MQLLRRVVRPGIFIGLLVCDVCLGATGIEIEDVRGDDVGAGGIVYPDRDDFAPGDLDLVSFAAEPATDGVWFEASFANPIRSPRGRVVGLGPEPVDRYARLGFYTFNLDIYIDQDGIVGSGNTATVPGRQAAVDTRYAWEKAVILTPRPTEARTLLEGYFERTLEEQKRAVEGRVSAEELAAIRASVKARVGDAFYFPSDVRVQKQTIRFFVPASYLGAGFNESWRYVVLVTGAEIEQNMHLIGKSSQGFTLMMMPVSVGRPRDRFGLQRDADGGQPPIVDLLTPEPGLQQRILSNYNIVTGQLATLPGVPSKAIKPEPGPGRTFTPSPRESDIDDLLNASPVPAQQSSGRSIAERLRNLNQLKNEGLVSDEEYKQLREKILSEI
ncbi:MAG: glucodextranase DOMON-like domain-containing protein [Pseudomonadota bacterium]